MTGSSNPEARAALLAPCPREAQILAAVAPWRTAQPSPLDRWTDGLAGWFGVGAQHAQAPAHVVDAIRAAYPLPATVAEAVAEHLHWEVRNREMGELLGPDFDVGGGRFLDLPTDIRAAIVRDLAEREIPARSIADLRARFGLFRTRGARDGAVIEAAMVRDLDALAQAPAEVPAKGLASTDTLRDRVAAALDAQPDASDRQLAKALGCSDKTIGSVRRALGLAEVARTVRRGGQAYPMKARAAQQPGRVAS